MFAFRDTCDLGPGHTRVEVAVTDATTDLGNDRPEFARSLAAVTEAAGTPFVRADQVHGNDVVVIEDDGSTATDHAPVADALVTVRRDVGLMVRVADCVPVLLADPSAGVIGVVHAGRNGVVLDVVGRAVARMRDLGAGTLHAWVGPHVCGGCYEVPEAMRDDVASVVPVTHARTRWGTPSLDLGAGVAAQLAAAGATVVTVGGCTVEDDRFHSHRRDGDAAGRLAGLVWQR